MVTAPLAGHRIQEIVMNFINFTPHTINLNDGSSYGPSGEVARVSTSTTEFDANGIAREIVGEITGLPTEPDADTFYIVSLMVRMAAPHLKWLVSPATNHPDCIRVQDGPRKGQIVSVPGFIGN
jgi:hypothetical protein